MPGSGDYFNTFLTDDFNSLDKEMGGSQWFQKEQERDSQRELSEQNELEKGRVDEEKESPASSTADPFRPTYDRKKSSESKKDRLERIKKEYEHKPFISVGSYHFWDDLKKRRDKRKQVQEQIVDQSFRDGLSANSPNLTQEVEQNEPTIMPKTFGLKGFCKKAVWEEEDDPTKAGDWWKPEEERTSDSFDSAESWKPIEERQQGPSFKKRKMETDPGALEIVPKLDKPEEQYDINLHNVKDKLKDFALNVYPKKVVEWNQELMEKGGSPIFSYEDSMDSDHSLLLEFTEEHPDTSPSIYSREAQNLAALEGRDLEPLNQAWDNLAAEEPGKGREFSGIEKEVDRRIKELTKDQRAAHTPPDTTPSAEELEKWLKSSGAKRFCKKAGKSVFATYADIDEARKEIKKLAEAGTLSALSITLLLGGKGVLAKYFDQELINASKAKSKEHQLALFSTARHHLVDTMLFLQRIRFEQAQKNPEIIETLDEIIESLEKIKNKHGF